MSIRDRMGTKSVNEILKDADVYALEREPQAIVRAQGKIEFVGFDRAAGSRAAQSDTFEFHYLTEFRQEADPKFAAKRFNQLQTLEEVRECWNAIAQTNFGVGCETLVLFTNFWPGGQDYRWGPMGGPVDGISRCKMAHRKPPAKSVDRWRWRRLDIVLL